MSGNICIKDEGRRIIFSVQYLFGVDDGPGCVVPRDLVENAFVTETRASCKEVVRA